MIENQSKPVLCVSLDSGLIKTNIFFELLLSLIRKNPLYLFSLPFWLLRGKHYFTKTINERANIDAVNLPYDKNIVSYLRTKAEKENHVTLFSENHKKLALKISEHLGFFDTILTEEYSDSESLLSKAKLFSKTYGKSKFDYLSKGKKDFDVYCMANKSILVNPKPGLKNKLSKNNIQFETLSSGKSNRWAYVRALRPHQWVKNCLVFVPLLASHRVMEPELLINNVLAFVAFCMAASSIYLINDLLDLDADRNHPSKRHRPFASGAAPLAYGLLMAPLLIIASFITAFSLPFEFIAVLFFYYLMTTAYSVFLKKYVLVDVMILAGLYTLRILAGGTASGITPTFWLLAFSMFLFLSLAFAKRNAELLVLQDLGEQATQRRQYEVTDLPALMMLGMSSGLIAVLVLALYINSEQVHLQYPNPEMIWLLCPLMLLWITRLWLKTSRGELHEDPVVFTLSDRMSQLIGLLCVVVIVFAIS